MELFMTADFLFAVGQIIMIDILLGGDNAVVIALACRKLPPQQRKMGILWGTAGAIVLRVILIFFALTLLQIPYLKIVGAILLLWIGVKLLQPEHDEAHGSIQASDKLWAAVKTVIVADFVMSLDNVIAIAGAAEGAGGDNEMPLVIFGLLVSIPIIVWGSQLVIKLMDRFPVIITLGGMLLGWIAGQMIVTDPVLKDWVTSKGPYLHYIASIVGAFGVLVLGKWLARRAGTAHPVVAPTAATSAASGRLRSVLLAVDGSVGAGHAAQHLIVLREDLRHGATLDVHLINVQRPVSRDVSRFVNRKDLDEYHRERSEAAFVPIRAALDAAGVARQEHLRVGDPGQSIAEAAKQLGCDLIIMGTRGLGSHTAGLLGSVAQGAVASSAVPVVLVK